MIYLIASIIIIIINVVPAFMPPTWTIVSFFYIKYEASLWLLTLIAAMSSSFGRYLLAKTSEISVPAIFSKETTKNMKFIGSKIKKGKLHSFLVALIWAISPVGSNPLFIAVGFAGTGLYPVLLGFFIGRLLSYFSLAYTVAVVVNNFQNMFTSELFSLKNILLNLVGFSIIFLYLGLDWQSFLIDRRLKFNKRIFKRKGK